jgi:crossover junction endodeoxyribonuclease RusA
MDELTLLLPWPPSVNTYWRHSSRGTYLSKRAREYKQAVAEMFEGSGGFKLEGTLEMAVKLSPPDARRRDLDNHAKGLLDALQGLAYDDDSQVDLLMLERGVVDRTGGSALVFIRQRGEGAESASFWALQHCS